MTKLKLNEDTLKMLLDKIASLEARVKDLEMWSVRIK